MPKRYLTIDIDFTKKDILKKFSIKQFDNANITINTFVDGVTYNPVGSSCKFFVAIANEVYMQEANIQVTENKVIINLDKNIISKYGKAYGELELTDSNGVMTSSSFIFDIENKIGEGATIPGSIEGFVERYERLIKEFKLQVDSTVKDCNTRVDNKLIQLQKDYDTTKNEVVKKTDDKIVDIEKRFGQLTASQQQDAEIIESRDGEISLPARLDRDLKYEDGKTVKDKIAFIEGLQESQNLKYASEKGFILCEETRNGVIDNLKLSGRTLVNLIKAQNSKYNLTGDNKTVHTTVHLSHSLEEGKTYTYIPYNLPSTCTDMYLGFYNPIIYILDYTSIKPTTFVCTSEMVGNTKLVPHFRATGESTINPEDYANVKLLILEGDHTQTPPSFFEGLKSVGDGVDSLEVMSRKEDANLFDINGNINDFYIDDKTNLNELVDRNKIKANAYSAITFGKGQVIKLPKNTNFTYKAYSEGNGFLCAYKGNTDIPLDFVYGKNKILEGTFNTGDTDTIRLGFLTYGDVNEPKAIFSYIKLFKTGNEPNSTSFKQHKKQILYYDQKTETWKKPILRELDSIEQHSDGKWYYHIKNTQITLVGTSNEGWRKNTTTQEGYSTFSITAPSNILLGNRECMSNLLPSKYVWEKNEEGFWLDGNGSIYISISNSKASTLDELKQYLSLNNFEIVCRLKQEEVYECTPLVLDSYEGETLAMFIGGAINPKLEFEVTSHMNNVIMSNKNRINYIEEKFTSQLREISQAMLSNPPDYRAIAYIAYPDDFTNTNENIPMVIPELY